MNWLDIVLLVLAAGSVISAFMKGFTRELVGLGAAVTGLLVASWFYGTAAGYLMPYVSSKAVANLLGFLAVFCVMVLLGALLGRLLRGVMKVAGLSFFDRLAGAAFGFARAVLLAVAVVLAVMAFSGGRKPPQALVKSRLAPYVMDAARACAAMAPYELREGFRSSYAEVKSLWNEALKKGIRALPSKHKENHEREI